MQIYHLSNIRHILNSRLFKLPFSVCWCIMTAIDCSVSYCSCTWPRLSHQRGGFNVWTGVHFLADCSLWWLQVIPLDKVCSNSSWNWEKKESWLVLFSTSLCKVDSWIKMFFLHDQAWRLHAYMIMCHIYRICRRLSSSRVCSKLKVVCLIFCIVSQATNCRSLQLPKVILIQGVCSNWI